MNRSSRKISSCCKIPSIFKLKIVSPFQYFINRRIASIDEVSIVCLTVSKFDYVRRNLEVKTEENALSGINVEASGIGRVLKSIADKEKKENDVSR